jgi:hypothetical protein
VPGSNMMSASSELLRYRTVIPSPERGLIVNLLV